jgi:hypothetical protein
MLPWMVLITFIKLIDTILASRNLPKLVHSWLNGVQQVLAMDSLVRHLMLLWMLQATFR